MSREYFTSKLLSTILTVPALLLLFYFCILYVVSRTWQYFKNIKKKHTFNQNTVEIITTWF
ncbi:MAG: hypothetical protein IPO63_07365 [Bacteroidetes bacterium]|nr:hypothetical protein [Bacteroidota bacterium]